MRVKVSDYIAGKLVEAGISQVFTVDVYKRQG